MAQPGQDAVAVMLGQLTDRLTQLDTQLGAELRANRHLEAQVQDLTRRVAL